MAFFYIIVVLCHCFSLILSCPQFAELYLENTRIGGFNVGSNQRRPAPSPLTCAHVCRLREDCTGFNFCQEENRESFCEFLGNDFGRGQLDESLAEGLAQESSSCSIYLMVMAEDSKTQYQLTQDPCIPNPCQNNHVCTKNLTIEQGYQCNCEELKFIGHDCQWNVNSSFVFGAPSSYIVYPQIPNFTGNEMSICFVLETNNLQAKQTIFQLYDPDQCRLETSFGISNQKVEVDQHSRGGLSTESGGSSIFKNLPTHFCYRLFLNSTQLTWQVSFRGNLIINKNYANPPSSPTPLPQKLALTFGDSSLDRFQEECKVIPSTNKLFEGKLYFIMVYASFISDEAVTANSQLNWFIDDSLQLTTGNFENYTHGAISTGTTLV